MPGRYGADKPRDGEPVPTFKVHFGYTDGISNDHHSRSPRKRYPPDHQQPCEPWLFVLRDHAENYLMPEPRELGLNGSFAVFKMIKTDVVGFEAFLQSNKDKIDPELLAAKMCGRWRNGVPLALSPETDSPEGGLLPEQLNNFEYVDADGSGDPQRIALPRRRAHATHQSARPAGYGPGCEPGGQTQYSPPDPPAPAVRAGLRSYSNPMTGSSAACSAISSIRASRTSTSSCWDTGSMTANLLVR